MLPQFRLIWDDRRLDPAPVYDELRWYVFDDRQMYRPGEEVHVKAGCGVSAASRMAMSAWSAAASAV